MESVESLWDKVMKKFEITSSSVGFELWIKTIQVLDFSAEKQLVLLTTSEMAKKQIMEKYYHVLEDYVKEFFGQDTTIKLLAKEEKDEFLKEREKEKEKNKIAPDDNNFNEKYTFESFVVGNSNKFVYAAAKAVAENPGNSFNPLFIYGGVGLGKTHLLHAIGNYLRKNKPNLKIKYITCEKFTNDYISSIYSQKTENRIEFREKYRSIDVLMVDDIQALANHSGTQEEFFNTFNELYQNKKQIILTSDRPPKDIATLSERLSSRFASGLTQDIQPPDYETRIAILRKKVDQEHYFIDDKVINYVADNINTNIREMEGILSKIHFIASLSGKSCADINDAYTVFDTKIDAENLDIDDITDEVCKHFNIMKSDIIGKKKTKEIVEPRMVATYLITELMDLPLKVIGKYFGGRDHTTIINARDKITEQIKTDNEMKNIIAEIKAQIKAK